MPMTPAAPQRTPRVSHRPTGLILRGHLYSLRLKVPKPLQAAMGRTHWVKALGTGRLAEAVREARLAAGEFEAMLRTAEGRALALAEVQAGPTLADMLAIYRADPTRQRTPGSDASYAALVVLVGEILGSDQPVTALDRAACRRVLETLRGLPTNYVRRFPKATLAHALALVDHGAAPAMSSATVNGYMVRLGALLTVAVQEGHLDRNPAVKLRVANPLHPRDRRHPFSDEQLTAIFNAPLYTGCRDDRFRYARLGPNHPRRARFWLPLIALYSGMRLNEIAQLDLADVRGIEGVECFVVSAEAREGAPAKRLKNSASRRTVPVHPMLMNLGFGTYLAAQRDRRVGQLFPELRPEASGGYYSDPVSKWFAEFLKHCGGARPRTSFHSFRHNFRDALRAAQVPDDVAMALGGWVASGTGAAWKISRHYGEGFAVGVLAEAIGKVAYQGLDLSHLEPQPV